MWHGDLDGVVRRVAVDQDDLMESVGRVRQDVRQVLGFVLRRDHDAHRGPGPTAARRPIVPAGLPRNGVRTTGHCLMPPVRTTLGILQAFRTTPHPIGADEDSWGVPAAWGASPDAAPSSAHSTIHISPDTPCPTSHFPPDPTSLLRPPALGLLSSLSDIHTCRSTRPPPGRAACRGGGVRRAVVAPRT